MIDIPERLPTVRLPLADPYGQLYNSLVGAATVMDNEIRDFRLIAHGVSVTGGYPFECAMYEEIR
jgi:hypothetical protein